ncbi:MAG: Clp protease N-terminal domain-containing protein, partial [Granulosicoccaceae bacterium]
MRAEKLTAKFQAALQEAQSLALGRDHQFIEPTHLLVAFLDQGDGSVRPVLSRAGADVNSLRSQLGAALDRLSQVSGVGGDVQPSNALLKTLNLTDKLSQKRKDQYIASELFLIALLSDEKSELAVLLGSCGADKQKIEKAIDDVRG